jgi:putative ABC transport system permease protein
MTLRLAARNLWRNRRRTLIALAALVVGTLMVVVLNGFRNGVVDLIAEGMVKAQTGAFQVHRKGFLEAIEVAPLSLSIEDTPELRSRILSVADVADLVPRISFSGLAANGSASSVVMVLAADAASESRVFPLARRFIAGRSLRDTDLRSGAVLGGGLMKSLKLSQGDTFTLTSQTPQGQTNAVDVQLEGWIPMADPFTGRRLMAIRLAYAQELLRMRGRVTEYAVQVRDVRRIDEVAAAVRGALGPDYEVHTWLELQPLFKDLIRRTLFVLSTVSLVLFAIVVTGIVNVMAMSVYERVREIGTGMALGMRRRQILRLFLAEGSLLGLWGSLAGAGLGWAIVGVAGATGVPFKAPGAAGTMPMYPRIAPGFLLAVVGAAVLGALLASLYPAWRASRMRPVDALRAS